MTEQHQHVCGEDCSNCAAAGCNCVDCKCSVRIRDLGVKKKDGVILYDVNLNVRHGEIMALIGRNGAGKTTLLKALLGRIPYTGEIQFTSHKGERVEKPRIGYVPQNLVFDHSSPMYELQFNRYTRGGISSPVCVLSKEGGQKCLDYYSLPPHVELHRVKSARYVAYPDKNASSYEISPPLIPAVCYTCAALVYEILGRPEQAAAMLRCIVR